jgi:hypothetical protein
VVTLTPKKPFALTKPVQVRVNRLAPSGLQDIEGRLIDGDHDGQPGGNAIAVLRTKGVTLSAVVCTPPSGDPTLRAIAELALASDTAAMTQANVSTHADHKPR